MGSLKLRDDLRVIAVPTIWKIEGGSDEADDVCLHVAKEMLGSTARLVHDPHVMAEAVEALRSQCQEDGRKFDMVDEECYVCHIGGPTWKEAGIRWIRVVSTGEGSEGNDDA